MKNAAADALDVDGEECVAGRVVLGLGAVAERMDLGVAMHGAVGRGEHELIERSIARRRAFGNRPAHPHLVLTRLRRTRNAALGPSGSSATRSTAIENPVENISVSTTSRAPSVAALAIIGASRAKLASRSSHTMSCWSPATFTP